jgi:protein-export membrane protein SecD
MIKTRIVAFSFLLVGALLGWALYGHFGAESFAAKFPFRLGLDLKGGTHLVYKADVANLVGDVDESLQALRETIERRVNVFGVAEPLVQTERGSALAGNTDYRLIVELPGVTDTQKAIDMIGKTPVLDFRLAQEVKAKDESGKEIVMQGFTPTELTGRYLKHASMSFGSGTQSAFSEPVVQLQFDAEGAKIFKELTEKNIGKVIGIFLDGQAISTPVVQSAIPDGEAVITGNFRPEEARELVRNLNLGALPVPITLQSSETIGSTLGADAVSKGVSAFIWGFALIALFFVLWYRLPGIVAVAALALYVLLLLVAFKLIPVTITAAAIAGLILSMGMAVDANVLIFERMKDEMLNHENATTHGTITEATKRAWGAIRDGHITSIISAIVLYWFGTSIVKGFALVFGLGVIASLFTAIVVSRTFLLALGNYHLSGVKKLLYGVGLSK